MNDIVIVGGGHAGAQLCAQLATEGLGAQVRLVCAEPQLPYQRPPLSKQFLKSQAEPLQTQRDAAWFAAQSIQTHLGDPVERIDRELCCVTLASGMVLPYGHLVLATGTRTRRLAWLAPALQNVTVLRDAADASNLRDRLHQLLTTGKPLTVLGGGFIGLEVAATARLLGLQVRVIEAGPRLLSRSVSPHLAEFVLAHHRASGIEVHLNASVSSPEISHDHLVGWQRNGQFENIDELLSGIGGTPETRLAEMVGLGIDDGILVDRQMRSSDPRILAIGDCARLNALPGTVKGRPLRLESVQNAVDQAKAAAAFLVGREPPDKTVPVFWSEQGSLRIQMAGLMPDSDVQTALRPGKTESAFSLFHYTDEGLQCVESVNAPTDHLHAKKLLTARCSPPAASVSDLAIDLKSFLT